MRLITIIAFAVILAGCCHTSTETITRTDTLIVPYTVSDTVAFIYSDTVLIAQDERIIIKVDTLWRKAWYQIRDTVKCVHTDTVEVTKTVMQEYSFWEKIKLGAVYFVAGIFLCVIGAVAFFIFVRR